MVQMSRPHETADTLRIENARKDQGEATRSRHRFVGRGWTLHHRDVMDFLADPGPELYDGVLCDPPYGLRFMRHHWDAAIPSVDVWSQLLRACKPGAHLLAFGGPKTEHRLACNIEDAGWELRDKVYWVHGEGFPKSLNIGKALERLGEETGDWIGYGTGLKPAVEPVILAMKPRQGSFAKNVFKHGCGGLNIDECRIGTSGGTKRSHQAPYPRNEDGSEDRINWARNGHSVELIDRGRFPANLVLDEAAAELLDRQSGRTRSRRSKRRLANSNVGNGRTLGRFRSRLTAVAGYDDEGSASRFFYVAKASRSERAGNDHPTVKPLALCEYLALLILPPERPTPRRLLVPFSGSGSEMLGGLLAGWDHVTGVEWDRHFCDVSVRRLFARLQPSTKPA
jgi:DNA modification methylase